MDNILISGKENDILQVGDQEGDYDKEKNKYLKQVIMVQKD